MKVIVETRTGFGGIMTYVYKYTQKRMREIVTKEFEWAKEYDVVMNKDEVEEILEEDEIYEVQIMEANYGVHYVVCDVE